MGICSVCGGCEIIKKKKSKQVQCPSYATEVLVGHMAEEGTKLTLRRLEAPIHKFIKVALPIDLDRLQKHHSNILKVTTHFLPDIHIILDEIKTLLIPKLRKYTSPLRNNR